MSRFIGFEIDKTYEDEDSRIIVNLDNVICFSNSYNVDKKTNRVVINMINGSSVTIKTKMDDIIELLKKL
jgi:hypothetical protein